MSALGLRDGLSGGLSDPRPTILEARGLTKRFATSRRGWHRQQLHAVDDVTLTLRSGAVTAVVGESGSGKSVLARMLARIVSPSSGEIVLKGRTIPLGERRSRAYASEVQLVLQDPFASMNPVYRVRHHLERPLRLHGTESKDLDERILDTLSRVALSPPQRYVDKYPHELSGGQLQRVSIARALAVEPSVLLADEPVSMLDVSIRLGILNLLADLRDTEGLAILYITHDIASARYLADEVIVMYAGQVVEQSAGSQLIDEPAHPYTKLLLAAAPDPAGGDARRPVVVRGAPPKVIDPSPGCRFSDRCPSVMDVCRTNDPPVFTLSPTHRARCFLLDPNKTIPVRTKEATQTTPTH